MLNSIKHREVPVLSRFLRLVWALIFGNLLLAIPTMSSAAQLENLPPEHRIILVVASCVEEGIETSDKALKSQDYVASILRTEVKNQLYSADQVQSGLTHYYSILPSPADEESKSEFAKWAAKAPRPEKADWKECGSDALVRTEMIGQTESVSARVRIESYQFEASVSDVKASKPITAKADYARTALALLVRKARELKLIRQDGPRH